MLQRSGDLLLLGGGDAIEEREGEGAAGYGFGDGKVGCGGAGMVEPGGLQVDGGEVAAGGDSALGESGLDAVAIRGVGKANDIDEPTDDAVGQSERGEFEALDLAKKLVVSLGGGVAASEDFVDAGELDTAEGAADVG